MRILVFKPWNTAGDTLCPYKTLEPLDCPRKNTVSLPFRISESTAHYSLERYLRVKRGYGATEGADCARGGEAERSPGGEKRSLETGNWKLWLGWLGVGERRREEGRREGERRERWCPLYIFLDVGWREHC